MTDKLEEAPKLPPGQWHLLMVPDVGYPDHTEYDRFQEFQAAASDATAARESGRFQGVIYAFVGKRIDLRDVKPTLTLRIDGVGTVEAGPPE